MVCGHGSVCAGSGGGRCGEVCFCAGRLTRLRKTGEPGLATPRLRRSRLREASPRQAEAPRLRCLWWWGWWFCWWRLYGCWSSFCCTVMNGMPGRWSGLEMRHRLCAACAACIHMRRCGCRWVPAGSSPERGVGGFTSFEVGICGFAVLSILINTNYDYDNRKWCDDGGCCR